MTKQHASHQKGTGAAHAARHVATRKPHGPKGGDYVEAQVAPEIRRAMIAEAAYFLAEKRGFSPGDEIQDWLEAESQIESLLKHGMRL